MPQYVCLMTWTDQGTRAVKDTVQRAEQGRKQAERFGVRAGEFLWTQGRYDGLLRFEAPDDETASAFMLAAGSQGFFRTETLRAFTAEEMQAILGKL